MHLHSRAYEQIEVESCETLVQLYTVKVRSQRTEMRHQSTVILSMINER